MKKICLGLIGLISGLGVASATCGLSRGIIPEAEYCERAEGVFTLKDGMSIGYLDESLEPAARYLADLIGPSTGYGIGVVCGEGRITLSEDSMMGGKDAYELTIDVNSVEVKGGSYGGVIAGIESLRQLLPPEVESRQRVDSVEWTVPCVTIVDSPRFEWRGLMLDVARHFHSKEEVMRLLDLMAMYKMNKFHWHLTDDQGWRVEIKRYPLLTENGAWRKFNSQDRDCMHRRVEEENRDFDFPSDRLRMADGALYGGYYTQDDIREIVEYARIRGIDIVPEIDMPGHMLAAVSNYAGVSCFEDTGWGKAFSSPVCPGKDSAMEFCRNVYSELIDLFPGQYIHVGGDEVEKDRWEQCEDCRKRMSEYGIETLEGLQSWFIRQIEELINSKGRRMVGWDEIVGGGLSPTATVMWWRSWSPEAPVEALKQGNEVILSPNAQFYLDYAEDRNSLRNIYDFDTSCGLDSAGTGKILGVQGNLWSEWVPSEARLQYMAEIGRAHV